MKSLTRRNNYIQKLRFEKNLSYQEIGKRYNLSGERIKHICNGSTFNKKIAIADIKEKYKTKLNKSTMKDIFQDIAELSKQDRRAEIVTRRVLLVKHLYDKLNIPFYKIGALLNRDHTTIIHLYNKHDE